MNFTLSHVRYNRKVSHRKQIAHQHSYYKIFGPKRRPQGRGVADP